LTSGLLSAATLVFRNHHAEISTLYYLLFVQNYISFSLFSPTTGLIGQSSNRHLHEQQGGMSLDELASNGSYIPRPEFSRNGK
jgi:hypothetical protein